MIDDEEYEDSTGDPELDFVKLERKYREKALEREGKLEDGASNHAYESIYIEYINHTLAAADALELDIFAAWTVPDRKENVFDAYHRFTTAVDRYSVQIKVAHGRGRRAYFVTLTLAEKQKVHHYVEQIKELLEKSSLSVEKRESLLDKLNAFLKAVDRDRTAMQAFSEATVAIAKTIGDAANELEPAWRWVHVIAAILGAHVEEQSKSLPPTRRTERLNPPDKRLPPPQKVSRPSDLDDDIPF